MNSQHCFKFVSCHPAFTPPVIRENPLTAEHHPLIIWPPRVDETVLNRASLN